MTIQKKELRYDFFSLVHLQVLKYKKCTYLFIQFNHPYLNKNALIESDETLKNFTENLKHELKDHFVQILILILPLSKININSYSSYVLPKTSLITSLK